MPTLRGQEALARRSRDDEPCEKRIKTCTLMCPKPAGQCDGCQASFGHLDIQTRDWLEDYFVWWTKVERLRRHPPYEKGQSVVFEGRQCRFHRAHSSADEGHKVVKIYDEEQCRFHCRVREDALSVPARQIPLPSAEALARLKYGKQEFYKLHTRYTKWMYELREQRKDSFRNLMLPSACAS